MKALIVEPSRVVALKLSSLLARHGVEARGAKSGEEALRLLAEEPADLVCFAYELGDMNGIDFFSLARARGLLRNRPGLLVASTHDKAVVDRAIEAGVTECYSKRQLAELEQFVERFAAAAGHRLEGRVLLVEDSATAALHCRRVLTRMGLAVDHCRSAEEAVDRLAGHPYDLVVVDYLLAGTETGLAVIRAVRAAAGRQATTPILAMSALDDTARKVEILRSGASDFVAKPVVAEELELRVFNLMTMRKLVRQLESQHEAMKEIAMHDQLTSLFNRHYLEERLPRLLREAEQGGQQLALIVMDIDHFKRINDGHGHKTGDRVLEEVAELLQGSARGREIMARVGGEELLAVLPETPLAAAAAKAETLRRDIEALRPGGILVTASFGVAALAPGETYEQLFRRADDAVYRAKAAGRNRVETA